MNQNSHPCFPDFKPLEMADRPAIEAFTRQFDPYSDFCFSTLTFYDCGNHTSWCWLNGNLVLRLNDSFGPGAYLTFLGCEQASATANTLIAYAQRTDCSPVLWRVPDVAARAIARESDGLQIEEDRDGFDYIYLTEQIARLEGSALHDLRRDVSRFERRHPHHRFVQFDLGDTATHALLRPAISAWQSNKSATGTMQNYCRALETCLRDARHFDLLCVGVVIGDVLAGFLINERIREGWFINHFGATNPEFTGLSAWLYHRMAGCGMKLGCIHSNRQEDLGDPGLRRFKMKCAPSGFLRKFSIRRKEVTSVPE